MPGRFNSHRFFSVFRTIIPAMLIFAATGAGAELQAASKTALAKCVARHVRDTAERG